MRLNRDTSRITDRVRRRLGESVTNDRLKYSTAKESSNEGSNRLEGPWTVANGYQSIFDHQIAVAINLKVPNSSFYLDLFNT